MFEKLNLPWNYLEVVNLYPKFSDNSDNTAFKYLK